MKHLKRFFEGKSNLDQNKLEEIKSTQISIEYIKKLLEEGYDIDCFNWLFIRISCFQGNVKTLDWLLNNGAGGGMRQHFPASWAAQYDQKEILKYLCNRNIYNKTFDSAANWIGHIFKFDQKRKFEMFDFLEDLINSGKADVGSNFKEKIKEKGVGFAEFFKDWDTKARPKKYPFKHEG